MIVAIDGPAGSGKSSISKIVSKKVNLTYIDTGAMYRALTWKALKKEIDLENETVLLNLLKESDLQLLYDQKDDILKIILDNKDITEAIREQKVNNNVSFVAKHKSVRELMVKKQQDLGNKTGNIIMDGRDIGTVVFPNADLKVFMTASVEERANRRFKELKEKGVDISLDDLIKEIETRDNIDSTREVAPLKPADDSIILDTTELNFEQVVEKIVELINSSN